MNDFLLIKNITPDKTSYINKETRVSDFIDETKTGSYIILWISYQMILLIK